MEDKILKFRVGHGWTQKQMALFLGVDQSAICKMEKGKYRWTPLTMARISQKLLNVA